MRGRAAEERRVDVGTASESWSEEGRKGGDGGGRLRGEAARWPSSGLSWAGRSEQRLRLDGECRRQAGEGREEGETRREKRRWCEEEEGVGEGEG